MKRTINGQLKPPTEAHAHSTPTAEDPLANPTPPCAQPQLPSSESTEPETTTQTEHTAIEEDSYDQAKSAHKPAKPTRPRHPKPKQKSHPKLPRLPPNATISKRPLLHPQIPTPYSSSASPKCIYIKASSPFIPAVKRIRNLLTQITKRKKQSLPAMSKRRKPLEANGRLKSGDVEVAVAEEAARLKGVGATKGAGVEEKEKVYIKATGRAIPRALELGVYFQGEGDCAVRVEMGSVKAIDDIEIQSGVMEEGGGEDVSETRIRTVSSVTVSIGLQ